MCSGNLLETTEGATWMQFDKSWAKALKIELQRLQEILRSQEV